VTDKLIYDPYNEDHAHRPASDFGPAVPMVNDPGGKPLKPVKDLFKAMAEGGRQVDGTPEEAQ
jgi:hypothetical protein